MATLNFNTSNDTFRQLLGNGVSYVVPSFQRDYSWTEENWDELWQDILALFGDDAEPGHYMGYLVLQTMDNKQFRIIDGQQRITTLSVMILAGLNCLKSMAQQGFDAEKNSQRIQQIQNTYIGYVDPVTLVPSSKLELNRNNDKFYQTYLVPLPDKISQRRLNVSEVLLYKAFVWFCQKMASRFVPSPTSGEDLARFLDNLVDRLFFTVIRVTDELNAFKVFETLNARGVRLSSTDLLKNWFFSLVSASDPHENEIRFMEDLWTHILEQLGSNDTFPDFLRIFWNSRHRLVRKSDLFKVIRKEVTTKAQVFEQLRALDYGASIYDALRDPHDNVVWSAEERDNLRLVKLFGVRQALPLLLAAYERFYEKKRPDFSRILRDITVVSLRYNIVCNLPPNEQESLYNNIATGIMGGKLCDSGMVRNALLPVYPVDDLFRQAFATKTFNTSNGRNKNIVRYLLAKIVQHNFGTVIDASDPSLSIEHILPEHPGEGWVEIDERKQDDLRYRLGNMTLLESSLNRDLGNADFDAKKAAYAKSTCPLTREIATRHTQWDEDAIAKWQQTLAKTACAVWRID